jgi:hypothetical protein
LLERGETKTRLPEVDQRASIAVDCLEHLTVSLERVILRGVENISWLDPKFIKKNTPVLLDNAITTTRLARRKWYDRTDLVRL